MPVIRATEAIYVHTEGEVVNGDAEHAWFYGNLDNWAQLVLLEAGFELSTLFATPYYRLADDDRTPHSTARAVERLNDFGYAVVLEAPEPPR